MTEIISPFNNWRKEIEGSDVDSIGEDYILFNDPKIFRAFRLPFKIDVTIAIICTQGTIKGMVNMKNYHVTAPLIFIILADQVVQFEQFSDDFFGYFIVMSTQFLENFSMSRKESASMFLEVKNKPFVLLKNDDLKILLTYVDMIKTAVKMRDNPYRLDMVMHLNQAFFFGTRYQFFKNIEQETSTKNEVLVQKFLEIVGLHFKEKRQMEFYAKKLFLTSKYLSKIIKDTSGKSGNEWIDSYVILEAKALLNSTNLTIQQISDHLNFTTQSFFGRYFKRHVGVSPKHYRNG